MSSISIIGSGNMASAIGALAVKGPHVFNNHRQQLLDRFCPLLNRGA